MKIDVKKLEYVELTISNILSQDNKVVGIDVLRRKGW